jgi:hypothetical protein
VVRSAPHVEPLEVSGVDAEAANGEEEPRLPQPVALYPHIEPGACGHSRCANSRYSRQNAKCCTFQRETERLETG